MDIQQGKLPNKNNYKIGRISKIQFIVIHYTANKGDTAKGNTNYFSNNITKSSAHFFVDENSVYTSVPVKDTAWHCGGNLQGSEGHSYYKICTNSNSIGIEMCLLDKNGNIKENTINNCIKLTKELMKNYNIPIEKVIRHWDVVGKQCPKPMIGNNNKLWNNFKNKLNSNQEEEEEKMIEELKKEIDYYKNIVNNLSQRIANLENPMIYNYIDKNIPQWAKEAVIWAKNNNIITGSEQGLNLTDKDLRHIVFLYRLYNKIKEEK